MFKMLSFFRPKRNLYLIAVLGPDGSGKSTLINNLMNTYKNTGHNYYSHLYPNLNSIINSKRIYPYSKRPYSYYTSILKIIYMVIINFLNYIIIFFMKKGKTIIWCDRFIYDIFADPKRYRISPKFLNIKFIKRLTFNPFLTIIINPPIESIYNRSKELSYKELSILNNSYKKLHEYLTDSLLITSEGSAEKVLEISRKHIDNLFNNNIF